MHLHVRMVGEKGVDGCCLVAADVVANDMDVAAFGLAGENVIEESDELGTGVTWGRFAQDLAGCRVERSEQAERAVPLVFETMAFRTPRRQRQHSVFVIEGLNRRLLVNAKHGGVGRRIEVQADDIGSLGLEVRIVGHHVAFEPMRLQVVAPPDALNVHEGDVQFSGQLAAAPVRRAVLRQAFQRVIEHARFQARQSASWRSSRMATIQARQSLLRKPRLPRRNETRVAFQLAHDRVTRHAVVEQQDQPRSSHLRDRCSALALQALQFLPLVICQIHFSHAPYMGCEFNVSMD